MKIKILQVIGSLKIGGAEKIALSILEYIDRDKYQVDYLVYDDVVSDYTAKVSKLGGVVHRINNYSSNPITMRRILYGFFQKHQYDIIHTHLMFHNGIVISAAKKAKINTIISHSHSTQDGKDRKTYKNEVYKIIMRRMINKPYVVKVACGDMAGEYLYGKKVYSKEGIFFKNRINGELFAFDLEKQKALKRKLNIVDKKMFIIIGHLVPLKNHKLAFEALEMHLKNNPNCILYVLGDGNLRDELKQTVIGKKISDSVVFTGNVSNVYDYILAADHLLLPSWYEGFPVTLIEAQAAGLHCIVSDKVTKQVDFTGLISWCSINDILAWEKAMNFQYNRKSQYSILKKNDYDFSTYKQWLDDFYSKVLE